MLTQRFYYSFKSFLFLFILAVYGVTPFCGYFSNHRNHFFLEHFFLVPLFSGPFFLLLLPIILVRYEDHDIYNLDEIRLFFSHALSTKSLIEKPVAKGGKQAKQRFAVCFCINATDEKGKPNNIWNSKKTQCFNDLSQMGVKSYYKSKTLILASKYSSKIQSLEKELFAILNLNTNILFWEDSFLL